jgi:hypothetical protein
MAVLVSALLVPAQVLPQAIKAGVVTTLQGTATVARTTTPEPTALKFKDNVFVQDRIVTAESSTVRILLGGKAVVTVRERSELTIVETPMTSTIEVRQGKIALAVAKERMKPGESVQIQTPNAVAGVRGTIVIAEVSPTPGAEVSSTFTLLTGIVDVSLLDPSTGRPGLQRVTLRPLQAVGVLGSTRLGAVRAISRGDARAIASDYKVVLPPPPAPANTQLTEGQIEKAVQHAAAVSRSRGGDDKAKRGGQDAAGAEDKGPSDRGGDDGSAGDGSTAGDDKGKGGDHGTDGKDGEKGKNGGGQNGSNVAGGGGNGARSGGTGSVSGGPAGGGVIGSSGGSGSGSTGGGVGNGGKQKKGKG